MITVGAFAVVLMRWIGIVLLLSAVAGAVAPVKRPRLAAIRALLGAVALLLSRPWDSPGDWSFPVAWLVMPLSGWVAAIGLVIGLIRFAAFVTEPIPLRRQFLGKSTFAWLACGTAFGLLMKFQGDPVTFIPGRISLDIGGMLAVVACAVASFLLIGHFSRHARVKSLPRMAVLHFSLVVGSLVFSLPFFWLLLTSFKEEQDLSSQNGLVFVPKVQVTTPYWNSKNPLFSASYRQTDVKVTILKPQGDQAEVEIQRPDSLHGIDFVAPRASLKEVPRDAPLVDGKYNGEKVRGRVIEEMDDGRRRVEILGGSNAGATFAANPNDLEAVRKVGLRFATYSEALDNMPAETHRGWTYVQNTLVLVILNILGTVFSSSIVAFAFARMRFPGRKFLFMVLLSTMMLPGAVTLLPTFLIYRSLGWIDTLKPLWVPSFFASAFNVFLLRQFFKSIPGEFEDAAKLDGCNYFRIFWSVMLPQIKPALAAISIWTFMAVWGDLMGPLIYLTSPEHMTISYAMQLFSGSLGSSRPDLLMAMAVMAVTPVIVLFFLAQRYFVESISLTGLSAS